MIRWSAYCQQFLGEQAPYESQALSHGICEACAKRGLKISADDFEVMKILKTLQGELWKAGKAGDVERAYALIDDTIPLDLRPIDVLMGLIGPMLYDIGNEWAQGKITVAEDHQFTAYAKEVLNYIRKKITPVASSETEGVNRKVLLVRVAGSQHTLGNQALDLYMQSLGVQAEVIAEGLSPSALVPHVLASSPRSLGISIVLASQRDAVVTAVASLQALTEVKDLEIMIGGFAVKQGEVEAIPGTRQLKELSEVNRLLAELKII